MSGLVSCPPGAHTLTLSDSVPFGLMASQGYHSGSRAADRF
jgi:hypothetical protein